jgi:hypothetical protein
MSSTGAEDPLARAAEPSPDDRATLIIILSATFALVSSCYMAHTTAEPTWHRIPVQARHTRR